MKLNNEIRIIIDIKGIPLRMPFQLYFIIFNQSNMIHPNQYLGSGLIERIYRWAL